jgi:hypothetical protein
VWASVGLLEIFVHGGQCCGSGIIYFGSGSYFDLISGFGSGLFMKNIFEMQII